MPTGLLGFEQFKKWHLINHPDEAPFSWLQVADEPEVAFLLVPPGLVTREYRPDVADQDVASLGLTDAADALLLNIVTLNATAPATVNLKGPIIINRRTLMAKQVVPRNAAEYSVRYPLPTAH